MTPGRLTRAGIYAAFGLTPEEVAEFEASPAFKSYSLAKAQAESDTEAFRRALVELAERTSAELNDSIVGRVVLGRVVFDLEESIRLEDPGEEGGDAS